MQTWTLHEQMLRNPPTDRMRDVHMLHHTQSVPMLDETSALHGNMPQHNDAEGGKQPRLAFSPAASVWGQMGRAWTTGGRGAPRTTEAITENDYVAFFHQFFGLTKNPALAPFANVPCPCQQYFMGGEGAGTTSTPASTMPLIGHVIKRVFITNVKGTFLGMSESEEASKRR